MKVKVIEKATEPMQPVLLGKESMSHVLGGTTYTCTPITISQCLLFIECGTNPNTPSMATVEPNFSIDGQNCYGYYTWTEGETWDH